MSTRSLVTTLGLCALADVVAAPIPVDGDHHLSAALIAVVVLLALGGDATAVVVGSVIVGLSALAMVLLVRTRPVKVAALS